MFRKRFPTIVLKSIVFFLIAVTGSGLAIWKRSVMFALLGDPSTFEGHAGAWAAAISMHLYVLLTFGAAALAMLTAFRAMSTYPQWKQFLIWEVVILGFSLWMAVSQVLKRAV